MVYIQTKVSFFLTKFLLIYTTNHLWLVHVKLFFKMLPINHLYLFMANALAINFNIIGSCFDLVPILVFRHRVSLLRTCLSKPLSFNFIKFPDLHHSSNLSTIFPCTHTLIEGSLFLMDEVLGIRNI